MARNFERQYQFGKCWLNTRRAASGNQYWIVCWYERGATRSISTGIQADFDDRSKLNPPPQEVWDALYQKNKELTRGDKKASRVALVIDILWDYYERHASQLASERRGKSIEASLKHFTAFLGHEKGNGNLKNDCTVNDLTSAMIERFHEWRVNSHGYTYLDRRGVKKEFAHKGVSYKTADTNTDYVRAALNWACRQNLIDRAPIIPSVPKGKLPGPRDRVLDMSEIVALFEAADKRFHQYPQDMYYLMVAFATAGRPEAICDLHTDWCVDYKRNLLIMNKPERMQTRKSRPTIPIVKHLKPWLQKASGAVISKQKRDYKDNITLEYGLQAVQSNRNSFNSMTELAGVTDVCRETIRHTATTILFEKNVPEMEVELYTGHSAGRSTSRHNYFKYRPDYHQQARLAMESFFDELSKLTKAPLRNTYETRRNIEIDVKEFNTRYSAEYNDVSGLLNGGRYWARTSDLFDVNEALYQLS